MYCAVGVCRLDLFLRMELKSRSPASSPASPLVERRDKSDNIHIEVCVFVFALNQVSLANDGL